MKTTPRGLMIAIHIFVALVALSSCDRRGAQQASSSEIAVVRASELPDNPGAAAWAKVSAHQAKLLLQDLVEPRQLKATTASVSVQALTDGKEIAFRLTWKDPSKDDLPGASRFSDACAVQLPVKSGAELPAPQMGEQGRKVQISYWRASWQAVVDGRKDTIKALYPGASVDHYPPQAEPLKKRPREQAAMAARYAPARALGNRMGGPRKSPVQDLVASGPGTLRPAGKTVSRGKGERTKGGWQVVIRRPLPAATSRSHVALAVWQGAAGEVGARKMRTGWIPVSLGASGGAR